MNTLNAEFDRQIETLIHKDYPRLAQLSEAVFKSLIEPLRELVVNHDLPSPNFERGTLPFVIVVKSSLVPTKTAMSALDISGKPGITKLFPHTPQDFNVIPEVQIPSSEAYLITNIDRGQDTLNVKPDEAFKQIIALKRSPLTIDEGVALVTHFPDFLMKNNCFSLLASRHEGDQRVPAIWINGRKHPNLGWCWNGNPHTWLGSASCEHRLAA